VALQQTGLLMPFTTTPGCGPRLWFLSNQPCLLMPLIDVSPPQGLDPSLAQFTLSSHNWDLGRTMAYLSESLATHAAASASTAAAALAADAALAQQLADQEVSVSAAHMRPGITRAV
jgi:hypothetical protein